MELNKCPGCLRPGFKTYCTTCLKKIFNGKRISHILNFSRPEFNQVKRERSGSLSISGIQVKHSLKLINKELVLTEEGGEYILKPVPSGQFENLDQVPPNEHLTMQTASHVYKIKTAENGIIFFNNGEMAYITKRFDVKKDGKRLMQEDFAQIAGKTEEVHGKNYKYDFSYEEIAELMKKYVHPYSIEIEKYFKVILFNYLFSNGDSHLKNFSLYRNEEYGDYLLTPFYDLLNTSIHVPGEKDMALELFKDEFATEAYKAGSKYTRPDFTEFANKLGINEKRFEKIYNDMLSKTEGVKELVTRSFLREELKEVYIDSYYKKLSRLKE